MNIINQLQIKRRIKKIWWDIKDYFKYRNVRKYMKDIPEDNKTKRFLYQMLLFNVELMLNKQADAQLQGCELTPVPRKKKYKHLHMRAARIVLDTVYPLTNIIGIQPMYAPTSLSYKLRYSYKDDNERPISLQILSSAVAASTRKLQAGWSIEMAQDLRTVHDIDIETELMHAIASEIGSEIIKEHMQNIAQLAATNETLIGDRASIGIIFNKAANDIAIATRRGPGNVIVTDIIGYSALQMLPGVLCKLTPPEIKKSPAKLAISEMTYGGYWGYKDNKMFEVYIVPNLLSTPTSAKYIIGYKGKSGATDAGYIWLPYVLFGSGGVVVNPQTFAPMQTFITRGGIDSDSKAADYYRIVELPVVDDIPAE